MHFKRIFRAINLNQCLGYMKITENQIDVKDVGYVEMSFGSQNQKNFLKREKIGWLFVMDVEQE